MLSRLSSIFIVSLLIVFCGSLLYASDTEEINMTQMKKIYTEVVNKGNIDLMDELCQKDFVEHEALPGVESNLAGVKQFFKMYRAAFPDLKFTVEQMIAKDDKVVTYITITGTQKGEFMGTPASGKKINLNGVDIIRFVDGKAAEHWGVTDTMTMMHQIGAIPDKSPEQEMHYE
jgi:steroid delta-isomerase-like uncharacterized protein